MRSELQVVGCFYLENNLFINHEWQSSGIDSHFCVVQLLYFNKRFLFSDSSQGLLLWKSQWHINVCNYQERWASFKFRRVKKTLFLGETFSIFSPFICTQRGKKIKEERKEGGCILCIMGLVYVPKPSHTNEHFQLENKKAKKINKKKELYHSLFFLLCNGPEWNSFWESFTQP